MEGKYEWLRYDGYRENHCFPFQMWGKKKEKTKKNKHLLADSH